MALKRLNGYAAFNIPQFRRTITTGGEELENRHNADVTIADRHYLLI